MSNRDLDLGTVLRNAVEDLPRHLEPLAQHHGLTQQESEGEVQWRDADGQAQVLFFVVPDPRDLVAVTRAYVRTREARCPLTYVYVHQWTDGEGIWDVFTIRPRRRMEHRGRFDGTAEVNERGPLLRADVYTLFQCGREFPPPGCAGWARLLAGPTEGVRRRLASLAEERDCHQTAEADALVWVSPGGRVESMFFILPDHTDVDVFIRIYHQIDERNCPVTFIFLAQHESGVYDIFRLSARSYLEHHNQAKAVPCM